MALSKSLILKATGALLGLGITGGGIVLGTKGINNSSKPPSEEQDKGVKGDIAKDVISPPNNERNDEKKVVSETKSPTQIKEPDKSSSTVLPKNTESSPEPNRDTITPDKIEGENKDSGDSDAPPVTTKVTQESPILKPADTEEKEKQNPPEDRENNPNVTNPDSRQPSPSGTDLNAKEVSEKEPEIKEELPSPKQDNGSQDDDNDGDDYKFGSSFDEDTEPKTEVEKANKKLKTLNVPERFKFTEENKNSILEFSITKEELKEMEFNEEDDEILEGSINDVEDFQTKLSIEMLNEKKSEDYKFKENKTDLLFTLKGNKTTIKINKDIWLLKGTNPEFKVHEDSVLKLMWEESKFCLAEKVGFKASNLSGYYDFDITKSIKFSEDNGTTFKTISPPEEDIGSRKEIAQGEEDEKDYNQGFKYTLLKDVTDNTNTLKAGDYEIRYHPSEG